MKRVSGACSHRALSALLLALAAFSSRAAFPHQGKPDPVVVVDYHLLSKTAVPHSSLYDYVYRVDVKNTTSRALLEVVGSVTSKRKSVKVVDGQASFGAIDPQKVKASSDTITVRAEKYFDRRLDRKVTRGGRLQFEEDGSDAEDLRIPGWPAQWSSLLQEVLDDLFRLKGRSVFDWTFKFKEEQGAPTISAQAPTGNVATDRPRIGASYQDSSGIATASVKLTLDGADVTTQSQVTASAVAFTPAQPLAQGPHSVTLAVADTAGNGSSASWTFNVDSLPPAVSGQTPRDTESASPASAISAQYADAGTGIDLPRTVLILDNQDVTAQATVTTTGVSYRRATPLANGPHAVTLRVADPLGNQTEARWTFAVDGAGPLVTGTSPSDVTLPADATPTLTAAFGDSGAGVDPASARLVVDGADVTAAAQVTASGLSYTPALPLAEGRHEVGLTVRDRNGNATDVQWGFTTRTDPEITSVSPQDTIVGAGVPVAIAAQYRDVGSGIDTAAVRLLVDDADVTAQAQVLATGITFVPGAAPLAEGLHLVALTVADKAGNAASRSWRFTTDAGLPVVTASAPKDVLIANATPVVTASYQDPANGSGIDVAAVRLTLDGTDVTGQAQVTASQVSYTPPTPLGGGTHAVTVLVADHAKNTVEASWSFAIDAEGPEIRDPSPSGATLPADALPQVSARLADRGRAGIDPASLRLVVDGTDVTAQTTLDADLVTWTAAEPLPEGAHTVQLDVADTLANGATLGWQFITSTPPAILDPLPRDFYLSEHAAPTISASFTDVGSGIDPGRTALLVDGADVTAQATLSATRIVYVAPALGAGTHLVRLTVFDRSDNHTESAWQFGVSTAPLITSLTPEGTLPPDSAPVIRATYEDAGGPIDPGRVSLSVDGVNVTTQAAVTGTSLEYTPTPPLTTGAHVATLSIVNSRALLAAESRLFEIAAPPIYTLEIVSPASGLTISSKTIEVRAIADSDVAEVGRVSIGDQPAQRQPTDDRAVSFSRVVTLSPGENAIPVQVDFTDGESRSASVAVTYDAPPSLAFTSPRDLEILGPASPTSPRDLTGNVERPVVLTGTVSKPVSSVTVNQQQADVAGLQFRFNTFFLHEGTNLISAVATDAAGATGSASITVFVDQTAPLLTVEAPAPGAATSSARIDVRGIVNDAVEGDVQSPNPVVTVTNASNGRTLSAKVADRYFLAEDVPLEVGINVLSLTATDHLGNARTREIRLSRVAVGSSRLTLMGGNRQRGGLNARLPKPLTVLAIDRDGNPLADVPIQFDVMRGTGVLDIGDATLRRNLVVHTDPGGTARVYLTLGRQSGEAGNMVRASHPSIAEDVVFTATGERGLPALVQAEGSGAQYAEAGSPPIDALSVIVYDDERNPVPDAAVTFTIEEGDAAFGTMATLQTATDKGGRAVARPLLGRSPGTVRVSATAAAVASDGSTTVEVGGARFEIISLPPSGGPTGFGGIVLDHKGTPLPGVRLSIGRTNLSATTGADGTFVFEADVPPGKLDLFVDGRFVSSSSGQQYPSLHFAAVAVRGQRNSLPHAISLPPLLMSEARIVGGPQDVTLAIPGFDGFAMIVKAGSVTFPDGSTVGPLVVSPVNLEKLPMVPPGGATTFMAPAWTIQPSGTRFDPPIEVHVPNSLALKPGETREVYQWDHDLATFVPMGRATVSEDGALLKTDEGSGITKAGWGGGGGGPQTNCADNPPKCKDCEQMKSRQSGNCTFKYCIADFSRNKTTCSLDPKSDQCGKCNDGVCDPALATDANTADCCGGKKLNPPDEPPNKYCCVEISSFATKRIERGKKVAQVGVSVSKCKDKRQGSNDTDDPDFFNNTVCPEGISPGLSSSGMPNMREPRPDPSEQPHCIDGCSVPAKLTPLAAFFNIWKVPGSVNNQDPTRGLDPFTSPTSYYEACAGHDRCYQTCGSDRGDCDSTLHANMVAKCSAAPADVFITVVFSNPEALPTVVQVPLPEACSHNASVYKLFLGLLGGLAHGDRQAQYCDCCPKQ